MLLNGLPMLVQTLQRLASHPRVSGIVVVISADDQGFGSLDLTSIERELEYPLATVVGGQTRSESVARGVEKILGLVNADLPAVPWVLVHDAARPCVRHSDIDSLLDQIDDQGGLLSVEVTDTLWQRDEQQRCLQTLPREKLHRAMTPQLFPLVALQTALAACHEQNFQPTDEAEAMRHVGFRPRLVAGSADNIKVTRAGDIQLAEFFLQHQTGAQASAHVSSAVKAGRH